MIISVVTSIYCDGYLARDFTLATKNALDDFFNSRRYSSQNNFELIFVNDGSNDNSIDYLLKVQSEFPWVKVIDLSRNFGQHEALACGFYYARGSFVIRANVDLQDHPSNLYKLLSPAIDEGYDLVVGNYAKRQSPWFNRLTAYLYYSVFSWLANMTVMQNTSPMRVMSRRFIDAYNRLTEKSRFPQGLDLWLGFNQKFVEIEHLPRATGKSSYTIRSRIKLALTGVLYFSDRPLILICKSGFVMAFIGILLGVYIIFQKIFGTSLLPGYASLAAISLLGFGFQVASLGVVGLYVGRIFSETRNRPLYIVKSIYESY